MISISVFDLLLFLICGSVSVFLLMTEKLNKVIMEVSCPYPCRMMYYFTGYLMTPTAATIWFTVCLWLVVRFHLMGFLILLVLFFSCRAAWIMAMVETINDEKE